MLTLGQFGKERFPSDFLLEPDLDVGRIAVGIVECPRRNVHMLGTRGAAIAERAAATPAIEPFYAGRRGVDAGISVEPFELVLVEHRPGDISPTARLAARSAV